MSSQKIESTEAMPAADPLPAGDQPTVSLRGDATPMAGDATKPVTAASPSSALLTGTPFGDYQILSEIARGGMGVVYKARQKRLNRTVALKMILAGNLASDADIKRFYSEAEAAAQLDHPGIVPIYEVGVQGNQHFYSMAFIDGHSLQEQLKQGPLPPRPAAELLVQVAEAVQFAHSKGIVHRDLKPHNILLDADGKPKVTDFGLAKRMGSSDGLTMTGDVLGTPSYMAPEQAQGKSHDLGPSVDVYALGAIMYAALTGRPAFQGTSLSEILQQVIHQEPVSPRSLKGEIPQDLETICLKCLRKDATKRYSSAGEFAQDLNLWLDGKPILARPVGFMERTWLWCKRRRSQVALSLVFLLLLVAGTLLAFERHFATRAAGVVAELKSAETDQVPDIVNRLNSYRRWVEPLLKQEFRDAVQGSRQQLHYSLALLPNDATQVDYLHTCLLDAEPREVAVIRDALAPHKNGLIQKLWALVESPETNHESQLLRAAAALAMYDPTSEKWDRSSSAVVDRLVLENQTFLADWIASFRPINDKLLASLTSIFRNVDRRQVERVSAAIVLADLADNPQSLADLLMDADPEQFAVLLPKLKERGLALLSAEIQRNLFSVPTDWTVRFFKWENAEPNKPPEQWEDVLRSPVLQELKASQLSLLGKTFAPLPPADEVPSQYFAALATADVMLDDAEYDLSVTYDDCVRVSFDGQQVFEFWGNTGATTKSVLIPGRRGRHQLKVEYFQIGGEYALEIGLGLSRGDKDKLAKRQANAAVALLRCNQPAQVWPLLKHSHDPILRSYLVHRLIPLGVDSQVLLKRLLEEPDVTIRRALLLSLGENAGNDSAQLDRKVSLPKLREIYLSAADPGLHAAAEWVLRTWQDEPWLKQENEKWAKDNELRKLRLNDIGKSLANEKEKTPPQWYVNTRGQTMVVIPGPIEFMMGLPPLDVRGASDVSQHKKRIGRTFAIGAKLVTCDQMKPYFPDYTLPPEYLRLPNLPAVSITWYTATKYANWLSKEEGLPEDQWCYDILGDDEVKLKANYLSLTGYRLPTEAELEYATRSGTTTSRYFGDMQELLPKYAWYKKNSEDFTWPVGSLKPNDLGLFDSLGNVDAWCQESSRVYHQSTQVAEDVEDRLEVVNDDTRVMRGGDFTSQAAELRSGNRNHITPDARAVMFGFRLARTLPAMP